MSHDAHTYLRARNVLLEILEMRGFDVSPLTAESPEEIQAMSDDLTKYYMTVEGEGGRKCRVFLAKSPQKAMSEAENHLEEAHPERLTPGMDEMLFVVFGPLSTTAIRNVIRWSRRFEIQADAVHVQNLLFNPFRHELVPEYIPISPGSEEETEILESVSIRRKRQLPVIHSSDIIARLLGLRKEQLVIVHNRGPGGTNRFVRVCLDG
jgi:DNA-directed RNA polymerase subunit H (RpoH/RPB5)